MTYELTQANLTAIVRKTEEQTRALEELKHKLTESPEWKVTICRGKHSEPGRWKWSIWSPTRNYSYAGFTFTERGAKKEALEGYARSQGLTPGANTYKVVVVGNEPQLVLETP